MPKICYVEKKFQAASIEIIDNANDIITNYLKQGYSLTLRQLYYQFVSRDLLPNTQKSYSRLGSIINDARLAGLIDWKAIEDRTRNLHRLSTWDSPEEIIGGAAYSYRTDKWEPQDYRIEVWIEKEALAGVFERVCDELEVPFFACRGYTSQSEMWRAAQRLIRWEQKGYKTHILHFGDHDPSGIDMTRDIVERLALFGSLVSVERMALTMDQVDSYEPPPNPAKITDSRFDGYSSEYGDESWELDALEPSVLAALVRERVFDLRDLDLWKDATRKEERQRDRLKAIAENWEDLWAAQSEWCASAELDKEED